MPTTAGSVMLRAAISLNDPNQLVYTNAVLLPFLNMGIDELDAELGVYNITPLKKDSIVIDVDAGDSVLASMPSDFVESIALLERPRDSSEIWNTVIETKEIDKNLTVQPISNISHWQSRGALINVNPPTSDREVTLEFIRGLTAASSSSTTIDLEQSRLFLHLVTARNAALDAGNSPTKAATYTERIDRARDRLVRRMVKNSQSTFGTRRRGYRGYN